MEYLLAMAEDEGVSSASAVAERLGKSSSYAATYQRILIKNQVIEQAAVDAVRFSIPHLRTYLRERGEGVLERFAR